jgi:hypothetical protein
VALLTITAVARAQRVKHDLPLTVRADKEVALENRSSRDVRCAWAVRVVNDHIPCSVSKRLLH